MEFKMSQEVFNAADTLVKVIGIAAVIIGGYQGLSQYKEQKERDFKKPFMERQLVVIDKILDATGESMAALTDEERQKAAKKFFVLYQGPAKLYLGPKSYTALSTSLVPYFSGCVNAKPGKLEERCGLMAATVGLSALSTAARDEISTYWEKPFAEIGKQKAWVPGESK